MRSSVRLCMQFPLYITPAATTMRMGSHLRPTHSCQGTPAAKKRFLAGALNLARFQAAGAHVHPSRVSVDESAHTLDVGVPPPGRAPVRVGDAHPEAGTAPANLAHGCHDAGDATVGVHERQPTPLIRSFS